MVWPFSDDWWWSNGQQHLPISITILASRSIESRWKLCALMFLSRTFYHNRNQCNSASNQNLFRWSFYARALIEQYATQRPVYQLHSCCVLFGMFGAAHPPPRFRGQQIYTPYKVCLKLKPFGNLTLEQVNLLVWRINRVYATYIFVYDMRKNNRPIFFGKCVSVSVCVCVDENE